MRTHVRHARTHFRYKVGQAQKVLMIYDRDDVLRYSACFALMGECFYG